MVWTQTMIVYIVIFTLIDSGWLWYVHA